MIDNTDDAERRKRALFLGFYHLVYDQCTLEAALTSYPELQTIPAHKLVATVVELRDRLEEEINAVIEAHLDSEARVDLPSTPTNPLAYGTPDCSGNYTPVYAI